ncbi:hypothetical protein J4G37_58150, partial [Microvirga sp. 3-52]|nr:hypothetical protein [Microvirga sp. 3-52]
MTENVISSILPAHGMNLGHATVGLELSNKKGIKVESMISFTTDSDFYEDTNSFIKELTEAYFSFASHNKAVDKIIIQNSLSGYLFANERFEVNDFY